MGRVFASNPVDGRDERDGGAVKRATRTYSAAYKQLHELERVNRDLKHTVDVGPVYHRREDRIRARV